MSIRCNPAVGRHFGFDFLNGGFSIGATPTLPLTGPFVAPPLRRRGVVRRSRSGTGMVMGVVVLRMRGCKYPFESERYVREDFLILLKAASRSHNLGTSNDASSRNLTIGVSA